MDIAKIRKKLKDVKAQTKIRESLTDKDRESRQSKADILPRHTEPETKTEKPPDNLDAKIEEAGEIIELLAFKLSKEDYAFRVSDVEEILRLQRITRVPKTDPFVLGITSLRGKIIPVVDLKKRLFISDSNGQGKKKIVILKGPKGSIGVLVDRSMSVIRVPASDIHEPPAHLTEKETKFIDGVAVLGDRFISIIHIEEILKFEATINDS
jgi:purine-binding chemotaxis protein CheW